MNSVRRDKIIFWTLTLLVLLPTGFSGVVELFTSGPELVVQSFLKMGYPLYLMKILGFAKIMGTLAILTNRFPRLTEWAYAGFTFDFLGATASHILANDAMNAPFPFVFFLLLMGSYFYWRKISRPWT